MQGFNYRIFSENNKMKTKLHVSRSFFNSTDVKPIDSENQGTQTESEVFSFTLHWNQQLYVCVFFFHMLLSIYDPDQWGACHASHCRTESFHPWPLIDGRAHLSFALAFNILTLPQSLNTGINTPGNNILKKESERWQSFNRKRNMSEFWFNLCCCLTSLPTRVLPALPTVKEEERLREIKAGTKWNTSSL